VRGVASGLRRCQLVRHAAPLLCAHRPHCISGLDRPFQK
jgi:hypothetical protein